METPTLNTASPEEIPDCAAEAALSKPGFSLARLVIILYVVGLFIAMAASTAPEPGEQTPPPKALIGHSPEG